MKSLRPPPTNSGASPATPNSARTATKHPGPSATLVSLVPPSILTKFASAMLDTIRTYLSAFFALISVPLVLVPPPASHALTPPPETSRTAAAALTGTMTLDQLSVLNAPHSAELVPQPAPVSPVSPKTTVPS